MTFRVRRALVVDDDPDVRTVARLALSVDGTVEVIACADGESAISIAAGFDPDVILLDVMMPDLDGPTTLARLRNIPALAKVPIIFLTARALPAEIQSLMALDAAAVLSKPFDPMGLLPTVREICHSADRARPITPPARPLTPNLRQRLSRDAAELTRLAHQWVAAHPTEHDSITAAAAHCTHKLHGAAAILGAPEVGAAAGSVNADLQALKRGELPLDRVLSRLHHLIEILNASAKAPEGAPT